MGIITSFCRNNGFLAGNNPTWQPEKDIPDQSGRILVVTGVNAGIGKETVAQLVAKGAVVYGLARNTKKGQATVDELNSLESNKGKVFFIQCDLSDLCSVRASADAILAKEQKIDGVIANAGVMVFHNGGIADEKTRQGHELQFGTNVLGHHFLLQLLKPALLKAAQTSKRGSTRIVLVSSSAHNLLVPSKLLNDWDPSDSAYSKYGARTMYGRSKLGNLHTMNKLADELEKEGIICVGVHPGNIKSELQRHGSRLENALVSLVLHDVYLGAISQLYAATAPIDDPTSLSRAYLVPWAQHGGASSGSRDRKLVDKTWNWCEEQIKGF